MVVRRESGIYFDHQTTIVVHFPITMGLLSTTPRQPRLLYDVSSAICEALVLLFYTHSLREKQVYDLLLLHFPSQFAQAQKKTTLLVCEILVDAITLLLHVL